MIDQQKLESRASLVDDADCTCEDIESPRIRAALLSAYRLGMRIRQAQMVNLLLKRTSYENSTLIVRQACRQILSDLQTPFLDGVRQEAASVIDSLDRNLSLLASLELDGFLDADPGVRNVVCRVETLLGELHDVAQAVFENRQLDRVTVGNWYELGRVIVAMEYRHEGKLSSALDWPKGEPLELDSLFGWFQPAQLRSLLAQLNMDVEQFAFESGVDEVEELREMIDT